MAEKKNRYEYEDVPQDVRDYLRYMSTVNNRSPRTIDGYHIDLRTFFRYLYGVRNPQCAQAFEDRNIRGLDRAFIAAITKEEIFDYLYYLKEERRNAPAARARKLSSIKGFFTFMTVKTDRLPFDPARDVSVPAQRKAMPKYLSLEESMELLKNIQSGFYTRDYCILTLFLNCGMRLSELVGINLGDFKEGTVRIVGKGDKERLVYLNKACEMALKDYLEERSSLPRLVDKNALFISKRTGRRMSNRRVEQVVEQCLKTAGLEGRGYSVHKLRHTAATLMYRYGGADMLALKEILGHAHVTTTEIYTHINTERLQKAVRSSPLSQLHFEQKSEDESIQQETEDLAEQDSQAAGQDGQDGIQ